MNSGTTDKERFIKSPQWFFREFLREARSLTQVKVMGEIINQTYGYHKQQDQTTLTRLSKVLNLSRDAVSKNIQPLVNAGFIELLNSKGKLLDTPELRRINGLSRQLIIFRIPSNLLVRNDDKYLSEVITTK